MPLNSQPIPDDWDEQQDGWVSMVLCVPNSTLWRARVRGAIYELTRGRRWDENTGTITDAQAIAWQIFESIAMGCIEELTTAIEEQNKLLRLAIEALVGGSVDFAQDPVVPDARDFSQAGVSAQIGIMGQKFRTSNWIAPDENIADILANSLMGRYVDPIPDPLNGDGLADILDEQIDVLHNRFRMSDSSVWNLFGEKNITETLETLFRIDAVFDLEILSNITSVLDSALSTGDATVTSLLKNLIKKLTADLNLSPEVRTWLDGIVETEERLTHADILLMIALAGEKGGNGAIARAIREMEQTVNVNNYNGCCGEEDCNCADAETQTITVEDLGCEDITVSPNGTG